MVGRWDQAVSCGGHRCGERTRQAQLPCSEGFTEAATFPALASCQPTDPSPEK